MYTCPNPACGKVFNNPLKALNLQQDTEPYSACPFCLTKIEEKTTSKQPKGIFEKDSKEQQTEKKVSANKPSTCQFHVGYLSERTQKEQIPEECLVCKDIVDCMLSRMR